MTSPRNTPRFGRWSSGKTPPPLDAVDDAFLDEWTGEEWYPLKRTLKVRIRDWFKHIADGYAVDEEDEDE